MRLLCPRLPTHPQTHACMHSNVHPRTRLCCSRKHSRPHVSAVLLCIQSFRLPANGGEELAVTPVHGSLSGPMRQLRRVHTVSVKQPTTEQVLLADLHVELWSLYVTSGKLAGWLVHVYNMHPDFERCNRGENCVYYNQIFMVMRQADRQVSGPQGVTWSAH